MIIKGIKYYTNITDQSKLKKCVDFCETGCSSYAISFDNSEDSIIYTANLKNVKVNYLRKMNFKECFMPDRAKGLTDSQSILKKGLDLIEIL